MGVVPAPRVTRKSPSLYLGGFSPRTPKMLRALARVALLLPIAATHALAGLVARERTHPTMRAQGESMTEQDIIDIATYLSQPAPGEAGGAQ